MTTMKVALLVLCLMSMIAVTIQLKYTCNVNPYSNGCSVPKGVKIEFKGRFKPACNKHDICYRCFRRFGLSRLQCDRRFKKNMKKICGTLKAKNAIAKFFKRESCKKHADIYFAAVRVGGGKSVSKRTPSWCRQKWVKPCMK
ncbi:conodipine-P3-like [Ylistrum balloti]|uniref:conodipine-P3-like n=1 Tax=Ylistrum balloti TaxID=509963 RepID=UPI002905AC9F|nr:conodipine-P3-like [Ylistrum balloti]